MLGLDPEEVLKNLSKKKDLLELTALLKKKQKAKKDPISQTMNPESSENTQASTTEEQPS